MKKSRSKPQTNLTSPKRIIRSENTWRQLIKQWKDSGLSQSRFCQQHKLSLGTFGHWKARLNKTDGSATPATFVPVMIKPLPKPAYLDILFENHVSLRVPVDIDPASIKPWIDALR